MPKYQTKQRKLLLAFLASHVDETFSARQIAQALEKEKISISAVYRNLAELETERKVRRMVNGAGREISYQFTDTDACKGCLHLSCKQCGRMFHMDTADADALVRQIAKQEQFAIDRTETVLYGICGACQEQEKRRATALR